MAQETTRDPIKALLDDLEQSIADFDQRLELATQPPAPTGLQGTDSIFPPIEPEAKRQLPPSPGASSAGIAGTVAAAPEAPTVDLLAELAQAAASRTVDDAEEQRRQQAVTERLHQDLKSIFDYLNQLIRHANTIKPALPRVYRLDARNSFSQLAWCDGFVDYRSTSRFDRSYYEQILFQVRYQAPTPLTAVCPVDKTAMLKRELELVNLRIERDETVMLPEGGPGVRYVLPDAIPLNLSIQADFAAGDLLLRCRNAGNFGPTAYRLPGGSITRPLLDGIGLVLLGRSDTMPKELQRIPYQRIN